MVGDLIERPPDGDQARDRLPEGSGRDRPRLVVDEAQQCIVDLVAVRPGDRVRPAFDHNEKELARHQAGQTLAGVRERQDPVGVAVDDQHRHVDLGEVLAEVGLPTSGCTRRPLWPRLRSPRSG